MNSSLLAVLPQTIKEINSAFTLEQLFQSALDRTLSFLNCKAGSIVLLNRAVDEVQIKIKRHDGAPDATREAQDRSLYHRLAQRVVQSGNLLHIVDVQQDELTSALAQRNIRSLLSAPIAIDARVLGVINVESPFAQTFSLEDEQFLLMIGEQIALAIEDHMLRNISTELSTLSVEKIMSKIAEVACFLFAARSSAVLLVDQRNDEKIRGAKCPAPEVDIPFVPRPNGLTYQVARSCKQLMLQDVQENPLIKATTKARGIQSILGVPLQAAQRCNGDTEIKGIGALFVDILEKRCFSEREQMLLQSLASQATIAIEKARHTRSLQHLNQIYLEIARSKQDIPTLAETLLTHAAKLVSAKGGRLCLLNEDGTDVQWAVMTNSPGQFSKIRMNPNIGVFGRVVETKQPFAMQNYQNWAERRIEYDKYQFTAVAGVPIRYQEQLWGVMILHDTEEGRIFDQEDLNLLVNLANLAAVAFSNASRLDDLERMMESASTSVIAIDNHGIITHFNRQAEQLLQYDRNEVIGKSITNIYYYAEDARRVQRLMLESPEGKIKEYATQLRNQKGLPVPIKLSASLLYDYEDKRSGSVGFFHDERRNEARVAIASLLDKQEIFRALVNRAWEITGASHSAHLALNIENKLQVTMAQPPEKFVKSERPPIDIETGHRIGISGRAFKTGESQLAGNVRADADYINFDPQTNSELAVPIKTQEGVIGVIDVQHPHLDAFNETDKQNLEMLAQFAAIAIQNSQLYAESQIDKRRFEAIANIIREAAQSLEVDQLLSSTSHRLESIFAEKEAIASIRLYDKEANVLRFEPEWHKTFHQSIDSKGGKAQTEQSLDQGICGLVARSRRSQNVGNVDGCEHFFRLISTTQSELSVPIHLDETGDLIGVLDLQSPQRNAFSQNDLEFLELLAKHLAVDIDKAQLAEREKRGYAVQETLRKVGAVVVQPTELEETLRQITHHVYHLAQNRGKEVNSVILRLVRGSKRVLAAAEPQSLLLKLQKTLGEVEIAQGVGGKIGISGRAILSGKTQNIGDVLSDPDYLVVNEKSRSELAIPIVVQGKVIAAMDIECANRDAFDKDDQQVFEALAAQAGIAIHGAYQYTALERRNRHQQAIYKASRIISRGLALSQRELLHRILEQAVELFQPANAAKVSLGVIQLYNEEKNELRRESIYPPNEVDIERRGLGVPRVLVRSEGHRIGINGRAVLEHRSQRVADVSQDLDYIGFRDSTRSELDVLLLDEDKKIIGVLGLESDELDAFDEEDEQAVRSLADLAVIAIRNGQQFRELEETKATLAARTAVAWLAAERATWQHKIVGHIGTIENYVRLLQKDLEASAPEQKLRERLVHIERVIAKTREKKIAQPLSPDQGLELVRVDEFVEQWLDKFYIDPELYPETHLTSALHGDDGCMRVNAGWFRLALDNLVNNAIRAMADSPHKEVRVETSVANGIVQIRVSDTGPGIPPEVQSKMFTELIKKEPNRQGEGIGLMLSKTVFETYGGGVEIFSTGPTGTSFLIWIPTESELQGGEYGTEAHALVSG